MAWVVLLCWCCARPGRIVERPYKTWGYPVVPLLFALGAFLIVGNTMVNDFKNSFWGSGGGIHRVASLLVLEPEKRKGDKVKGRNEEEGKIRTFRARANPFLIGHLSSVISHRSDK